MQDRLTFELSEFYGIFEKPLEVCLGEVSGLTFEVTVGPDVLPAILAGKLGRIDGVVGPSEWGAAGITGGSDIKAGGHF
jgi:hypothetical protein